MRKIKIFIICTLIVSFNSCSNDENSIIKNPTIKVESIEKIAEINNSFGWNIFNEQLKSNTSKNILISPLSIQTALSMTANGANGKTLNEMLKVLYCVDCDVKSINKQLQNLQVLLTKPSNHVTLTLANGYFYDEKRINLKPDFKQTLEQDYICQFKVDNFDESESALNAINQWVKSATNGKIVKILDQIGPLDVSFLINALHFKADWSEGFDSEWTQKGGFTTLDGTQKEVLYLKDDRMVPFYAGADELLVDIPFKDSTFSLSLVMPLKSHSMPTFNQNKYDELIKNVSYKRAYLSFPKMKLSFENDLINSLEKLGMISAFYESKADFKSMGISSRNIFINQIKHKAIVEIDEKGAEGAAVTSIGFGTTEAPLSLIFDRPYLIVLRHIATKTLVFIGQVNDPSL